MLGIDLSITGRARPHISHELSATINGDFMATGVLDALFYAALSAQITSNSTLSGTLVAEPTYLGGDETAAIIAAMTVKPNAARTTAIDNLVYALKNGGVWAKLDVLYVLAAHHEQAGRINWKNPGTFDLTAGNSPSFTTDTGFTGSTSAPYPYLDTGFILADDAVHFGLTNGCAIVKAANVVDASSRIAFAMYETAQWAVYLSNVSAGTQVARMYWAADGNPSFAGTAADPFITNLITFNITGSSARYVYNGTTEVTFDDSAQTISALQGTYPIYLLARNTQGTPTLGSNDTISLAAWGAALSSTNRTALNNAVNAYFSAL